VFGVLLGALCLPRWPGPCAEIGLFAAFFAAAAGPVLRAGSVWTALAGLPVLWTGIEVLRGTLGAFAAPWPAGWLSLGYTAPPGAPEAAIASVLGVHGLSLLFALGNAAFFLVLRARTGAGQIILGAAATAIPLAIHGAAGALATADAPAPGVPVVVASQARRDVDNLVRLTDRLAAARPRLVAWPGAPAVRVPAGGRSLLDASGEAADLAVRLGATLILGIEEGVPGTETVWRGVAVVEPDGRIAGKSATTPDGEAARKEAGSRIFPFGRGAFGLAIGSELASPAFARGLVRNGAGILVLAAGHGDAWSKAAERLHQRMVLFRAIECRRSIAKSGRHGAFLADPRGRMVASVAPGLEGAAVEESAVLDETTLYVRAGWLLEPCSAGGAIALVALFALFAARRARVLNARSPACPRGAPRALFRT
jgi:apolipoprotein N-acyltransferase